MARRKPSAARRSITWLGSTWYKHTVTPYIRLAGDREAKFALGSALSNNPAPLAALTVSRFRAKFALKKRRK